MTGGTKGPWEVVERSGTVAERLRGALCEMIETFSAHPSKATRRGLRACTMARTALASTGKGSEAIAPIDPVLARQRPDLR